MRKDITKELKGKTIKKAWLDKFDDYTFTLYMDFTDGTAYECAVSSKVTSAHMFENRRGQVKALFGENE